MARRKSIQDLDLQRFRLSRMNLSSSRRQRVENAYSKYKANARRAVGYRGTITSFLTGEDSARRTQKVSRRQYMGLANG